MKRIMLVSLFILALCSILAILKANDTEYDYNLDVFPNPMDSYATVSAYFTDKIPITFAIIDSDDMLVKTIYNGISSKGQMQIPFDRIDNKGSYIPNGKYWVLLSTNVKYTSTKKLLILK